MNNLDSLFTVTSLLSLQGATAASLLVPNVLGFLVGQGFDRYRKWVSFGLAMVLAFVAAALAPEAGMVKWLVALFNGFLIFASAIGLNQIPKRNRPAMDLPFERGSRFFRSWS